MSNHQVKLPQEILKKVFSYLQRDDLFACLLVCNKWYVLAKRYFYTEIKFARFSSIDPFIATVQSDSNQLNLLVKKITFSSEEYHNYDVYMAFKERFPQLIVLCPHIEKIACSDRLKNYVVEYLHRLPVPLKYLSAFPYCDIPEYTDCTRLYSHNLKEYVMENFEARLRNTGVHFEELVNFPRLQTLLLLDTPACTLKEVEYILNVCQDLNELTVALYDKVLVDDFDGVEDANNAFRPTGQVTHPPLQINSKVQMQRYSKMKRLAFQSSEDTFDLELFNSFLSKFNRLERFELKVIDILTAERPSQQLDELVFFLIKIIHSIPSVSFTVKGAEVNKIYPVALHYLQTFFVPHIDWKHTSLKIYTTQAFYDKESVHYATSRTKKHRTLAIILPEFESNNLGLHEAYVETFAPYTNSLEINFEYTRSDFNPCDSFVYNVFSQCTVLHSLAVFYGSCLKPLPPTSNTTLHTMDLRRCLTSPKFLKSLSFTCVNLRQLTLSASISHQGIIDHIVMPKTELEQLSVDLEQLRPRLQAVVLKITTSKIEKLFHIDFKKRWCLTLKKAELGRHHGIVKLKFKRVKRLKILRLAEETTFDLE
jgi:hypothetical protein